MGELWRRVQVLRRRDKFARELEEEMRLHREMKEKELIDQGIEQQEARYAASRQFGNAMHLRECSAEAWHRCSAHSRAGHRSKHGDFQLRQRVDDQAAALSAGRKVDGI